MSTESAAGAFGVGERVRGVVLAVVTGLVSLVAGGLTAAVVQSVAVGLGFPPLLRSGLGNAAFAVALGFVAMAVVLVRGDDVFFFDVRWPTRREWKWGVGGVAGMIAIFLALTALDTLVGLPSARHSTIEQARSDPQLLLVLIVLSWTVIGPGEELLFRNVVQKYLYEDFTRRWSVVVGCLVFASMHVFAYATQGLGPLLVALVNLFLVSLVLGVVYDRTRNVVVAAFVHGTYDVVQFGLAYVVITTGLS